MSKLPIGLLEGAPITEAEWKRHRLEAVASLPVQLADMSMPDILMRFQKALLASTATFPVTVAEKSRRTGATWAVGSDAVLTSGAQASAGGMDTLYIGYNLDMAREFIDVCAMWAKHFAHAAVEVGEFLFDDGKDAKGDRAIQAYRIRFGSGFEIVALSSRPRSLRGRQGYVILDEFAHHDDADELLKAAFALLIWGGKLLVISTHNGENNPFNKLIQDIREKKKPGNVVRCTFDEAIIDGLYQRVCLKTGKPWSLEAEAAWRAEMRKTYGVGASEELDCVPTQGTGVYIPRVVVEACSNKELPEVARLQCPDTFALQPKDYREKYVADWLTATIQPLIDQLDPKLKHDFGQDFARLGDLSIYVPMVTQRDLRRRAPFVLEMRNVPFEQQRDVVAFITSRLPNFGAGKMDASGNGAYLAEVTQQKFGSCIEAVKMSQGWYLENMPPLKAAIEDRACEFPADSFLVDDVAQIRLMAGIPMVPANAHSDDRDGGTRHGDFAVALCLAFAASKADALVYRGYQAGQPAPGKFDEGGGLDGPRRFHMRADDAEEVPPRFGKGTW